MHVSLVAIIGTQYMDVVAATRVTHFKQDQHSIHKLWTMSGHDMVHFVQIIHFDFQ